MCSTRRLSADGPPSFACYTRVLNDYFFPSLSSFPFHHSRILSFSSLTLILNHDLSTTTLIYNHHLFTSRSFHHDTLSSSTRAVPLHRSEYPVFPLAFFIHHYYSRKYISPDLRLLFVLLVSTSTSTSSPFFSRSYLRLPPTAPIELRLTCTLVFRLVTYGILSPYRILSGNREMPPVELR